MSFALLVSCSQFHSTHVSLGDGQRRWIRPAQYTHHGISDSMTLYRCGAMRWMAAPRADGRVLATFLEETGTRSSGIRA